MSRNILLLFCLLIIITAEGREISKYRDHSKYSWPPSTRLAMSFNAGSAKDHSGNEHNGTVTGPLYVDGKVDGAFHYDAQDDYIVVANHTNLEYSASSKFAIELWCSIDLKEQDMYLVAKRDGANEGIYLWHDWQHATGNLRFTFYAEDTDGNTSGVKGSTITKNLTWYHLFLIHNTANDMRIYVNGVEESYVLVVTNATGSYATGLPLYIGGDVVRDQWYFDGIIDEVYIYDRIPSEDEI